MNANVTEAERVERDLLGERAIPPDAYWGVHTLRAMENFQISGTPISNHPHLIRALAAVKHAAALANLEAGLLEPTTAEAIVAACEEVATGALHDEFVVDVVQGGAGTSTNMNANEVIANRALELLGRERGDYGVLHPNEHVNLSQSTNDVYPTALRVALIAAAATLDAALGRLAEAFAAKAGEFADAVKLGRTQLQDAVPMTLGQELAAHAATVERSRRALGEATRALHEVNLGGTAIGTGIATPPGYAPSACRHLAQVTGLPLTLAGDLIAATSDAGDFVELSGALRRTAVALSKIANDLRLLSSGPRGGFAELRLPPMQAGSSLMPGKVNPVIPEVVNQIAFEVIGLDVTVTLAAEGGQLQLNAFEPIIYRSLDTAISRLCAGCDTLADRCVAGIDADREQMRQTLSGSSVAVVTALSGRIGYAAASDIATASELTGRPAVELALERELLDEEELRDALHAASLGA